MSSDSGIKDGFAKTKGYGRIHYREIGSGPALMLMHTNGASAHQYDIIAPLLAKHFRVISWDMPGHGDSDRITRHYTMEDHAKALAALMTAPVASVTVPVMEPLVAWAKRDGPKARNAADRAAMATNLRMLTDSPFRLSGFPVGKTLD